MSDLRNKYLATRPGKLGTVDVEGWGTVYLRSLSLNELDALKALETDEAGQVLALVQTILLTVCDDRGQRVFTDADEPQVRELPVSVLRQVTEAAAAHTVASAEKVDAAKKD